jgi:hypothetical protein
MPEGTARGAPQQGTMEVLPEITDAHEMAHGLLRALQSVHSMGLLQESAIAEFMQHWRYLDLDNQVATYEEIQLASSENAVDLVASIVRNEVGAAQNNSPGTTTSE